MFCNYVLSECEVSPQWLLLIISTLLNSKQRSVVSNLLSSIPSSLLGWKKVAELAELQGRLADLELQRSARTPAQEHDWILRSGL